MSPYTPPSPNNSNGQYAAMRWISFVVITILFIGTAIRAIFYDGETDKILAIIFLVIVGMPWGANLWNIILKRYLK